MLRTARWGLFLRAIVLASLLTQGWQKVAVAENVDPQRPAAIEAENVPVVPAGLVDKLKKYQDIRHVRFRGWSPHGKGMLIQTIAGNTPQLHRLLTAGGERTQVTFETEPVDGRFVPHREDGFLAVMSAGGNENDQLYWHSNADRQLKLLTDGKSRNILETVSPDGRWVAITSNRRNGRDMDVLVADLARMGTWTELLQVDKATWQPLAFSPDSKQLLLMRVVSINERYPALLDVETKRLTPIRLPGGTDQKVAIGHGVFARDGKSIYLTTDAQNEFLRLARIQLADFSCQFLTSDIPWDIDRLALDSHTGRLAFTANENGISSLWVLDAAQPDGKQIRRINLPAGIIDSLEFSPQSDQLGFTLAALNAPAEAYSLDLKTDAATRWTNSQPGKLGLAFVEPQPIAFRTFDGRQIPGYAFYPPVAPARSKSPVLVIIHGGPESQYRPLLNGTDQFYLNELGIAVIYPNVRGSAGYGKTYLQLDNADKREDSLRDIGALLDWIKLQPELDADRVAVMGGSYGGYMVLGSLVMHGQRLRAGIDIVGIANFVTFLETTSDYRRDLRRVEYGDERDPVMRAIFDKISPARNAHRIQSALLVAHGRNDPRVPFSEARQIAPLVRQNGQDVWTVYAANEGHGFKKKDNRDYFAAVVTLFLQQHLQTHARPVKYEEHQDLTYYLDEHQQRQPIRQSSDWEIRRQQLVTNLQEVMGPLPSLTSRVNLDVKILEEQRIGTLLRRKISYQSDADDRVSAWMYLPEHAAGTRLPAVLCLQQTTNLGKDEPAGLGGDPNLHYALHLAERGYVTLAPDYPSFGEHKYDFAAKHGYASGSMKAVWDNIRAVDLLTMSPDVDAARIGCIGHSLGGHNALFTAMFEPRLKVIVSSCGFCTFLKDDVPSWNGPRYMPRIASVYDNSAAKLPFDFTEIVASLAPRPFLACAAVGDDDFDVNGVKDVIQAARPVYQLFGKDDHLQAYYPAGGHGFPKDAREVAYKFLDKHLQRANP